MAKVKITKKELPFLKRDLNIDEAVLKDLVSLQAKYKTRHKKRIEATNKEAVERYTAKIDALKTVKANMLKEFNAEIRGYQRMVKNLSGPSPKARPRKRSPRKPK